MRASLTLGFVISVVASAVTVGTLATADVMVKTEYDTKGDFTSLRTYTWLPTPPYTTTMAPQARDERFERDTLDEPIRAAVDRVLSVKRFTFAEPDASPDAAKKLFAKFPPRR